MTLLHLRIVGRNLPGLRWESHQRVHVGVQKGQAVVSLIPGSAEEVICDLTLDVEADGEGSFDFRGPFAQGKRGERFIYLSWGDVGPDGQFVMFRRAKLWLSAIDTRDLIEALERNAVIEARLDLTDAKGGPICASVRPPAVEWRLA
jgi:hypothetical protein